MSTNKLTKINKPMFQNRKFTFFLLLVVVLVLLGGGVWIGVSMAGPKPAAGAAPSGYIAVYMTTGDIYFGKPSWFPSLVLRNSLYLQRSVDQSGKTQLGLSSFTDAFWRPVGDIHINSNQVLFWAPVREDSQIVQAIENPGSLTGQPSSPAQGAVPAATSSASSK
jgi:hypothetical protein